jgi:regulator of RNase E activity RraB
VLENLKNAGDDLSKSRLVDHWFYFKNIFDRDLFLENIKETTFKVVKMEVISSEALPYQVQLAREDFVDMSSISKVTKALRHLAKKYNGKYDGWETFVIKQ